MTTDKKIEKNRGKIGSDIGYVVLMGWDGLFSIGWWLVNDGGSIMWVDKVSSCNVGWFINKIKWGWYGL